MLAALCCFLFVFASAEQETITAESGQNVTLTCRAPNSNNINTMEWHRPDLEPVYVLLFRDGHVDPDNQHPSFKDRVDLQDRQMKDGDVSVILKNVTVNDTGTYECHVFEIGAKQGKLLRGITLRVVPPGSGGAAGLIVSLPDFVLLLVLVAVGFVV
ncbi:butyrophilin-like protein 8 [Archocentrus centrarchus]|uniref:butyrophilin-like protein 8 n=1 Tax=Archocentrus centrarchus TaxID=63155 RepID=UPI0011EA28E4|nr:butyrophilin-like protein 8 [Archocentrus centrarchus]XP_030580133.1 butyrophilin-like protein 8 [Archocentrus centrarchus]